MKRTMFFLSLVVLACCVRGGDWPTWKNVGPGGGGWIQSIACDRFKADVVYVGCDVGGFYRSDDGGKTYQVFNEGLKDYFVEVIAQHPTEPEVIFLGCYGGVYKSVNGGRSWEWKRKGMPAIEHWSWSTPISCIVFEPGNPSTVYAGCGSPRNGNGTHRGSVFKSEDGGETWKTITDGKQPFAKATLNSLVVDPTNVKRLLVSTSVGVFCSEDGGATWSDSSKGLPGHLRTRRLVMAPSKPNVLYLSMFAPSGHEPWGGGVFRSDDGGRTWQERNNGFPKHVAAAGKTWHLTSNIDRLQVHPSNPDIVYAGGAAWVNATVYKTVDGGLNWEQVVRFNKERPEAIRGWITFWGPSVYCMSMSLADPERIYYGTSGQVLRTLDGGKNWGPCYFDWDKDLDGHYTGTGLEVTCLHSLNPHPRIKDKVYCGYFDIGLMVTPNAGRSFRRQVGGVPGSHVNSCFNVVFDGRDDNRMWGVFGSWGGGGMGMLMTSEDGGVTWSPLGPKQAKGVGKGMPLNLTAVYRGGKTQLYMSQKDMGLLTSVDGGKSWHALNEGLPSTNVRKFGVVPGNPNVMYCFFAGTKEKAAACFRSRDAGVHWEKLPDVPFSDMKRFAIAPDGSLYMTAREGKVHGRHYAGGLFISRDGGQTWEQAYGNRFVEGLAIDPFNPRRVVIGLNDHPFHDGCRADGAFLSEDGGTTWTSLNSKTLHNTNVTVLVFDPIVKDRLWAGTGGNGIFRCELKK